MMMKLMGLSQLAALTGISRWTLRYWLRRGQGPAFKRTPGGRFLFREKDVLRWLSELKGPAVIEAPEPKEAQAA